MLAGTFIIIAGDVVLGVPPERSTIPVAEGGKGA
jgi:hypothetical protein